MENLVTLVKNILSGRKNEYDDDMYLKIYKSFQKHYPTVTSDELEFVTNRTDSSTNPLVVFRLGKDLICCSNDLTCSLENECECCCWRKIKCITNPGDGTFGIVIHF